MKRCYSLFYYAQLCSMLLLAGCSLSAHKSAQAPEKPAPLLISNDGVGGLNAHTPMTAEAIDSALHHRYQLLEGMQIRDGKLSRYIEARKEGEPALEISGNEQGISRIIILDPTLSTSTKVKLGTPFYLLYHKAYGVCQRTDEILHGVSCRSPANPRLHYLFNGDWQGPEELLPADDVLRNWTLRRIIWQSN